jgi:hypothetical protein
MTDFRSSNTRWAWEQVPDLLLQSKIIHAPGCIQVIESTHLSGWQPNRSGQRQRQSQQQLTAAASALDVTQPKSSAHARETHEKTAELGSNPNQAAVGSCVLSDWVPE